MAYLFMADYYIQSKLQQLKYAGIQDHDGKNYTETTLKAAIAASWNEPYSPGLARQHYETFGGTEGLSPNPYFNENEYLQAKAAQLNSIKHDGRTNWTAAQVADAIKAAGFSCPAEHYEQVGAFETDANGLYINPSNAFDANAYWPAKLLHVRRGGYAVDGKTGNAITQDDVIAAFREAGLSPISHYALIGAEEANETGIAFAQTVPVGQRVPSDAAREALGLCVPANYGANTAAPGKAPARAAPAPTDVGGLADETVSAKPVIPGYNLPVPGDEDYVPLPSNIRPNVPGYAILPPSASGSGKVTDNFLVVDLNTGTATVVAPDGVIKGQVPVTLGTLGTAGDGHSGITVTLPPSSNVAVDSLPPVSRDDLPPCVSVLDNLDNNFVSEDSDPGSDLAPDPDSAPDSDPGPDPDPDLISFTGDAAGDDIAVAGDIPFGETAGFALTSAGALTDLVRADASWAVLGAGREVDASGVTGTGTLTINTQAFTGAHSVKGSGTASNEVVLGAGATAYIGGTFTDIVRVAGKSTADKARPVLSLGAGNNRLELTNADITLGGTAEREYLNIVVLRGGENFLTLANATAGYVHAEGGTSENAILVKANATVIGGISLQDSTRDQSITVESGGRVSDNIMTGSGNDTVNLTGAGATDRITLDWLDLGAGVNTLTLENARVANTISGEGSYTITLKTGGELAGGIDLRNDADPQDQFITVESGGTVSGGIETGSGNDCITVKSGATVTGFLIGGKGADAYDLDGAARTIVIAKGDTGAYAWTTGDTISVAGADTISNIASGTTLKFGLAQMPGFTVAKENAFEPVGNDEILTFRGSYNSQDGSFQTGGGNDLLLAYDADGDPTAEEIQAVVLIGAGNMTLETTADGVTFA